MRVFDLLVLGGGLMILLGLGLCITGSILFESLQFSGDVEVMVDSVNCFDNKGNKIVGVMCEKTTYIVPNTIENLFLLGFILFGLGIIVVFGIINFFNYYGVKQK